MLPVGIDFICSKVLISKSDSLNTMPPTCTLQPPCLYNRLVYTTASLTGQPHLVNMTILFFFPKHKKHWVILLFWELCLYNQLIIMTGIEQPKDVALMQGNPTTVSS